MKSFTLKSPNHHCHLHQYQLHWSFYCMEPLRVLGKLVPVQCYRKILFPYSKSMILLHFPFPISYYPIEKLTLTSLPLFHTTHKVQSEVEFQIFPVFLGNCTHKNLTSNRKIYEKNWTSTCASYMTRLGRSCRL